MGFATCPRLPCSLKYSGRAEFGEGRMKGWGMTDAWYLAGWAAGCPEKEKLPVEFDSDRPDLRKVGVLECWIPWQV